MARIGDRLRGRAGSGSSPAGHSSPDKLMAAVIDQTGTDTSQDKAHTQRPASAPKSSPAPAGPGPQGAEEGPAPSPPNMAAPAQPGPPPGGAPAEEGDWDEETPDEDLGLPAGMEAAPAKAPVEQEPDDSELDDMEHNFSLAKLRG